MSQKQRNDKRTEPGIECACRMSFCFPLNETKLYVKLRRFSLPFKIHWSTSAFNHSHESSVSFLCFKDHSLMLYLLIQRVVSNILTTAKRRTSFVMGRKIHHNINFKIFPLPSPYFTRKMIGWLVQRYAEPKFCFRYFFIEHQHFTGRFLVV